MLPGGGQGLLPCTAACGRLGRGRVLYSRRALAHIGVWEYWQEGEVLCRLEKLFKEGWGELKCGRTGRWNSREAEERYSN